MVSSRCVRKNPGMAHAIPTPLPASSAASVAQRDHAGLGDVVGGHLWRGGEPGRTRDVQDQARPGGASPAGQPGNPTTPSRLMSTIQRQSAAGSLRPHPPRHARIVHQHVQPGELGREIGYRRRHERFGGDVARQVRTASAPADDKRVRATAANRSATMSAMPSRQPAAANSSARARPRPLAAPVMKTRFAGKRRDSMVKVRGGCIRAC